jgi:hypothetical protein
VTGSAQRMASCSMAVATLGVYRTLVGYSKPSQAEWTALDNVSVVGLKAT